MLYRLMQIGVAAAVVAMLMVSPGIGQQVPTGPTLASAVINVNEIIVPWIPIIMPIIGGIIIALLEFIRQWVKARTGALINDSFMRVVQVSLENAAGKTLMSLGDKAKNAQLSVSSPEIRQAIIYVNQSAAEAVKHFDLTDQQIAEKILAKLGVLTASNPESSPKDVTPPPPDAGQGG